jgi:hypothetical protein
MLRTPTIERTDGQFGQIRRERKIVGLRDSLRPRAFVGGKGWCNLAVTFHQLKLSINSLDLRCGHRSMLRQRYCSHGVTVPYRSLYQNLSGMRLHIALSESRTAPQPVH